MSLAHRRFILRLVASGRTGTRARRLRRIEMKRLARRVGTLFGEHLAAWLHSPSWADILLPVRKVSA